jgi:putative hydrolase of the HAD superfamily
LLIIFDLDDTLLDTSGAVTPFKMRECLKRLIEDGANVGDFEQAYADLMALNNVSLRSKDAVSQFAERLGCDPTRALAELSAPLPRGFSIPMTPGAKEILGYFCPKYPLVIATGGYPPFQREKIEKAGLEPSIFSKIAILEDSNKQPLYEGLPKEFSTKPEKIWVCGDRVETDLAPAHRLGFKTVHMKWGRGKMEKSADWIDFEISTLSELKGFIR